MVLTTAKSKFQITLKNKTCKPQVSKFHHTYKDLY